MLQITVNKAYLLLFNTGNIGERLAPVSGNCVWKSERRKKVRVYCVLTKRTQKRWLKLAPVIGICVRKEEKDRFRRVYCILTKWTQKRWLKLAPVSGNCVRKKEQDGL